MSSDTENNRSSRQPVQRLFRYNRQMLFPGISLEGQKKLLSSRVVLMGCGALGSSSASMLIRAGVGFLRIVDRDFVELDNLQRQMLFDEQDAAENLPKAEAARRKLSRINSEVQVEAIVADINHTNVEKFVDGCELILDGLDNFQTRLLVNDVAVKAGLPWVYGACVGSTGLTMPILPAPAFGSDATACLRCVLESMPSVEVTPTCETEGIIAPIVNIVASFQVASVLKILTGRLAQLDRCLLSIDVWTNNVRRLRSVRSPTGRRCVCCGQRKFEFLEGKFAAAISSLCGRDAVQVYPTGRAETIDFARVAEKLAAVAEVNYNEFILSFTVSQYKITLFANGRAIISGTNNPAIAMQLYSRYIGI